MQKPKPTILILDDVLDNIKVIGSLLGRSDYSLLLATSGQEAIQLALQNKPDLMLLDIMVPDLDGLSVCRRLKDEPDLRDVPIIFLTAKTEVDDINSGYDAGCTDYLTKPFHARELKARVKTQLELKFLRERVARLEDSSGQSMKEVRNASREEYADGFSDFKLMEP